MTAAPATLACLLGECEREHEDRRFPCVRCVRGIAPPPHVYCAACRVLNRLALRGIDAAFKRQQ